MENYYMLRICRQSFAQLVKPHVNNTFTTTFKLFSVIFFQPVASKFILQTLIKEELVKIANIGISREYCFYTWIIKLWWVSQITAETQTIGDSKVSDMATEKILLPVK